MKRRLRQNRRLRRQKKRKKKQTKHLANKQGAFLIQNFRMMPMIEFLHDYIHMTDRELLIKYWYVWLIISVVGFLIYIISRRNHS